MFNRLIFTILRAKKNLVNIPELGYGFHGNVTECRDVGISPGRSFLFFLTYLNLEIGLSRAKVCGMEEFDFYC